MEWLSLSIMLVAVLACYGQYRLLRARPRPQPVLVPIKTYRASKR